MAVSNLGPVVALLTSCVTPRRFRLTKAGSVRILVTGLIDLTREIAEVRGTMDQT
jgi:hypothetical protein